MKLSFSSVTKVLRERPRGGAHELILHYMRSLNVELGLMCIDEKDSEELNEMYGPLCSQGYEKDHVGFKNLMWYGT